MRKLLKNLFSLSLILIASICVSKEMPKALSEYPIAENAQPSAGKLVYAKLAQYENTDVHHCLYLPKNYQKGKKYPIIVEYTGNKWGVLCSGKVEDAKLGYSITLGKDFIWLILPYVSTDSTKNQDVWWGSEDKTVDYAKKVIPEIIKKYNGDKNNIILCGFSRGAIAVSYIGLRDADLAKYWSAFISHDHFDGMKAWGGYWGSPLEKFRKESIVRLSRAKGKPWYISCGHSVAEYKQLNKLTGMDNMVDFTYQSANIGKNFTVPNEYFKHSHTDKWALFDTPEAKILRNWLYKVLK